MKCQKDPSFTSSLVYILHLYQLKLQDRLNWRNLDPELQLSQHNRKARREAAVSTDITVIPGSLHGSESIPRTFGLWLCSLQFMVGTTTPDLS